MEYYQQIDGKKMDGRLLKIAAESVKGSGDGRISKHDAEKMLAAVLDGNIYTDVEKTTIQYILTKYHWTDTARDWFDEQIKNWQHEFEKPIRMTPAEVTKEHFPANDVLSSKEERQTREHNLLAATTETYQDHDDIGIIVRLANGRRVEVLSNFIELAGQYVELRGGHDIPLRAIEKVEI